MTCIERSLLKFYCGRYTNTWYSRSPGCPENRLQTFFVLKASVCVNSQASTVVFNMLCCLVYFLFLPYIYITMMYELLVICTVWTM